MLDFRVMFRRGSEQDGCVVHESHSCDFTIDGFSLLDILVGEAAGHKDFLGCFARGWNYLNDRSIKQLLLQSDQDFDTDSGRVFIYVCPECADIGCGAYGCHIIKTGNKYVWSNFAYENGYTEPQPLPGVGPFEFNAANYEAVVQAAYAL